MARVFLMQARAEMLKFWRVPAFAFFSLGLPLIIFTFFGLQKATQPLYPHSAITVGTYVMASMAAYTVGNVSSAAKSRTSCSVPARCRRRSTSWPRS